MKAQYSKPKRRLRKCRRPCNAKFYSVADLRQHKKETKH